MRAKINVDLTMTAISQVVLLLLQLIGIIHLPLILLWLPSIIMFVCVIALLVVFILRRNDNGYRKK